MKDSEMTGMSTEVYVLFNSEYELRQSLREDEIEVDICHIPVAELLDALRQSPNVRIRFGRRKWWTPISSTEIQKSSNIGTTPAGVPSDWEFPHWVTVDAPTSGWWRIAHGHIPAEWGYGISKTVVQRCKSGGRPMVFTMGEYDPTPLIIHAGDADSAGLDWLRSGKTQQLNEKFEEGENTVQRETRQHTQTIRDKAHRKEVMKAYGESCAVCGFSLTSASGLIACEAAHIRPVQDEGADGSENGILLCPNHHWMFDEGIISVSDEYTLLISEDAIAGVVPTKLAKHKGRNLHFPEDSPRPVLDNIRYHRKLHGFNG